eukprot:CAMPEP_0201866522 /NCGR_PEP_ID=MMETSP0902-20130614/1082_1 /ASSEMBLY_ACC=CAM_ASM_000551 /TAXON_ID=420261 /ORGANISM="Thalassiosira antarctica, Strain CCMP982" /LENGTH=127 /DNA_ID=CAMNT_0048391511 /DNA_START=16 /DNA_END=399 /DNA_ORIENTATION=+
MMKTTLFLLPFLPLIHAFAPYQGTHIPKAIHSHQHDLLPSTSSPTSSSCLHLRIDNKRRKELGISDDEEEYDLDVALSNNTDPLITKIIAGSFILVVLALLVVGLVIPSITDFGDGVCSPIQNGGRC